MKPFARLAIASCICTLLLAGCGGDPAAPPQSLATAGASKTSALTITAANYHPLIQRVYLAYFGRPADPAGLAFFAQKYLEAAAPHRYRRHYRRIQRQRRRPGAGRQPSAEPGVAATFTPAITTVFIAAIYRNLFNRTPTPPGEAFWVDALDAGAMTRASAAISIMAGAQDNDRKLMDIKK